MSSRPLTRRRFLASVGALLSSTALAACGASAPTPTTVRQSAAATKTAPPVTATGTVPAKQTEVVKETARVTPTPAARNVTLYSMHWNASYAQFAEKTADPMFEASHPGVKIKREMVPGNMPEFCPKLIAMHAAGTPWDFAELQGFATIYVMFAKGIFKDLTPLINSEKFDLSVFFPAAIEACKSETGIMFQLPLLIDNGRSMLVYNADLLAKAGIKEPTPAWRFDVEFVEALRALKPVLGKDEFASPEPWTTVNQRIEAGLANWGVRAVDDTGRVFQAATGQGKAFFQFWDKLLKEGLIIKPGTLPAAPRDVFNGGKLALHDTFLSVWLQSKARVKDQFKIGCTHIPQGPPPGGKTSGIANTHQYAIHSDTKNLDLSWEYIKFFTGPELAQPLWDFPLPPARPALWQKNMSADPAIKLAADIMPSIRPNVRIWNGRTDEMWSGFQSDLDNIWLGKTDFETGFATAIKNVNNVLAKPMA